ncbi:methyl-accepting chemotaxis protein [Noviherbaspirillum aerium]|uniref:methyl-accepting chemotaxis protein n=1 Tax=Noviherbaspirillum aerium TaxID=2588497 RepID=UPI00124EEFF9|nr:methyl-accepting chemotaxis protein [Noviherbaspirillum aerium]
MRLNHLKIGTRLALLAGCLLAALIAIGLQAWLTLEAGHRAETADLRSATQMQEAINQARTAQVQFKIQVQEWKNILLRGGDPALFAKYRDDFVKTGKQTQDQLQQLRKTMQDLGLDIALVDDAASAHRTLGERYLQALGKYDSANPDSAPLVDAEVKGMDRAPTKKIDDIVAYVVEQSRRKAEAAAKAASVRVDNAALLLLTSTLLAAVIGAIVTVWLSRSITRPLSQAVQFAQTVASGDLRTRINAAGSDETAQLLRSLSEMNASLSRIVADVRSGTDTIAAASSQISAGNHDLSARTERQASSLEETASSMEELTGTVRQNADNARQASQLAGSASEVAAQAGAVVSQVVQTMASINDSARRIADIISVIDGIAFQTNILALNAAVEAARAGEQGRGFAVVATEVRTLAQRSAAAAREIKELISDSMQRVEAGTGLVDKAGETMKEVVASVHRVNDIIGEISTASQEQTAGIEQVHAAVADMDGTTQQNAALVEEAAAAASAMQQQANNLAATVGVFKLA